MVNGPSHIYIERDGKIERVDVALPERRARPADHRPDHHPARPAHRRDRARGSTPACPTARASTRSSSRSRSIGPVITVRKFSRHAVHGRRPDQLRHGHAGDVRVPPAPASRPASTSSSPAARARARRRPSTSCRRSSPNDERIVTIEDAAELQLRQEHVVTLEARPPNLEGEGEITIRDLLRNAMHMRPGPDHRRRVPLGRGAGHAPGDDDRPRRLALDRPREHARRTCSGASRRWSS